MNDSCDAIVLGLGAVGSFALLGLARQGARVLGIERFDRAHDRGSSHGGTRVTRQAYFEHPDYVPLLRHATAGFEALEQETGTRLLERCGVLLIGRPDSVVIRGSSESAERWGIPVSRLSPDEVRTRFPQFRIGDDEVGLFEPGAGFVRPEASIRAALSAAEQNGAQIRTTTRVEGWKEDGDGVQVHLDGETLRAKALVIAAGAWTPVLVPSLAPLLRVTRQVQAWISPAQPELARPERLPCWLIDRGQRPPLYGIPADPLAEGPPLAKIAIHGEGQPANPDEVDRVVHKAELEALQAEAHTRLPGLPGPVSTAKTCIYTLTPDEHFIVDRVPGAKRAWVAAGLSGHGFKLAPALGDALAELTLTGRTELPVGFLAWSRPSRRMDLSMYSRRGR